MIRWEYWKIDLPGKDKEIIPTLDKFGDEGWQVVSIYDGQVYFKREIKIALELTMNDGTKERFNIR